MPRVVYHRDPRQHHAAPHVLHRVLQHALLNCSAVCVVVVRAAVVVAAAAVFIIVITLGHRSVLAHGPPRPVRKLRTISDTRRSSLASVQSKFSYLVLKASSTARSPAVPRGACVLKLVPLSPAPSSNIRTHAQQTLQPIQRHVPLQLLGSTQRLCGTLRCCRHGIKLFL